MGPVSRTKKKIFDRFYRGSESRTDSEHFGLGLSVASQIAELHHTHIQVFIAPDGGAVFRFLLQIINNNDGNQHAVKQKEDADY